MPEKKVEEYEEAEEYEMSILDRLSDSLIDALASFIELFRKGWKKRSQSKIKEWKLMAYAINRSPPTLLGVVIVIAYIFIGIFGPYLAPWQYDFEPILYNSTTRLAHPGATAFLNVTEIENWHVIQYTTTIHYPLGADTLGRDILSILLAGARVALVLDVFIILIGPTIGIILGLISGYYGGKVDETIMRITDMFLAFPGLILAIALSAVLPGRIQSFLNHHHWFQVIVLKLFALSPRDVNNLGALLSVFVALIIVWWPGYARITRGSTLTEKENLYVEAARAIGLPTRTILFRHILPNIIGPILVMITMDFGNVILTEAGLSFLGLGAVPPIPDWGNLINQGASYFPQAWWLVAFPGIVIVTVVLGWNLLGDGLRDVLDPKTRRSLEFKVKKKAGGEKNA
ncbi:ABC transporter permease [Thermococcus sp. Bubb.Bath]|uniref:ABC transporter permease n=1 Tax=Thermococcus sp. Bubb.Bath TaxID=1638242 RepID=UPI00143A19BB|nr:ABC transporter permease [Thermococcus sp. Bubb.Bath]NJF24351.1 ABC transporter permease [Thermococcus sp. Bubb.Bath]